MTSLITRLAQAASEELSLSPFVGTMQTPEPTAGTVVAEDVYSFCFSSDGLKLITCVGTNLFNEYNLSVAWDINTKTLVGQVNLAAIGSMNRPASDMALIGNRFFVLEWNVFDSFMQRYNLSVSNTLVGSTITQAAGQFANVDIVSFTWNSANTILIGKTFGADSLTQYNTATALSISALTLTTTLALTDPYLDNTRSGAPNTYGEFSSIGPDGVSVLLSSNLSFSLFESAGGYETDTQSTGALITKTLNTPSSLAGGWSATQNGVWSLGQNAITRNDQGGSEVYGGCVKFNNDGTKYYTTQVDKYQYTASGAIPFRYLTLGQYSASTPYLSGPSKSDVPLPALTNFIGEINVISFDGRYLFSNDRDGNIVYRYTLNTLWDATSADVSYETYNLNAGQNASIDTPGALDYHFRFSQDGLYFWGMSRQYSLSTPWDLTSRTSVARTTWTGTNQRAFLRYNRTGTKAIILKAGLESSSANSPLSPQAGLDSNTGGSNRLVRDQAIVVQIFNISTPFNPNTAVFVEQKIIDSGFSASYTDASGNSDTLVDYMAIIDFDVSGDGREIYVLTPFSWIYRIVLGSPWSTSRGVTVGLDKYAIGNPNFSDYNSLVFSATRRIQIKPTGKRAYIHRVDGTTQQVDLW